MTCSFFSRTRHGILRTLRDSADLTASDSSKSVGAQWARDTMRASIRRGPVLMHVGKVSARRGRSAHICADHDYARFSLSLSYLFCSFISLDPWSPSTRPFADLRFPTNPHRESNEIYLYLEIPVSRICAIIHPKFA